MPTYMYIIVFFFSFRDSVLNMLGENLSFFLLSLFVVGVEASMMPESLLRSEHGRMCIVSSEYGKLG